MTSMKRSGVADLPLHGGTVPPWLASRMMTLGTAIAESVLSHYGRPEFLSRLSDPFWFQALGSVMGMDWHSPGITTSAMNALKKGLNPKAHELGVYICGSRGKQSRDTSIAVLGRALDAAKLGHTDKLGGFKRLDAFTRAIEERRGPEADVEATIAHERAISRSLGGRTVFDDRPRPKRGQLDLF